ncbi:MAG TPA: hypothetical protein PKH80_05850 [Methanofastidiosum sp.]|nr:hypothetical protein [Methanofastidiosum sp.]
MIDFILHFGPILLTGYLQSAIFRASFTYSHHYKTPFFRPILLTGYLQSAIFRASFTYRKIHFSEGVVWEKAS